MSCCCRIQVYSLCFCSQPLFVHTACWPLLEYWLVYENLQQLHEPNMSNSCSAVLKHTSVSTPGTVLTALLQLFGVVAPSSPRGSPSTHLCWASRTSPCRASSGRCATALWRTRWRWSCTEGSPRRRSCRSSRRRPSPARWELAVWRPDEDGCQQGFEARLEHAGKGKSNRWQD